MQNAVFTAFPGPPSDLQLQQKIKTLGCILWKKMAA
jgi:hypothetical protein